METPPHGHLPAPTDPNDLFGELEVGLKAGASDWQYKAGEPCRVRVCGEMWRIEQPPLAELRLQAIAMAVLDSSGRVRPDVDAAFAHRGEYFRMHTFSSGGAFCFNLRHVPGQVRPLDRLGVPQAFREAAAESSRGLILVTGPAGSGKSTTLASVVDHRNRNRSEVILTLEDPIEFRHPSRRAVVRQMQKGQDFGDFEGALRGILRCDPDVILVGELRDRETIAAALAASEIGHLVLGTLHGRHARDAIARILDAHPAERAAEVRAQLAGNLVAVLTQQLVRTKDRKLAAAYELLLPTQAVRHVIADPAGQSGLLANEISTGRAHGMISMDQSLEDLWRRRVIDREEALRRAVNPAGLEPLLRG
jgi:twitching motility protein PilT